MNFMSSVHQRYKIVASLNDWSGEWVHFTDVNKIGINPQQFHQDLAGVYLFPKEFKTSGNWKHKKFKFTVKIDENAKILDLSKLHKEDFHDLLNKLNVLYTFDGELNSDTFWDVLKNYYCLSKGKNIGKWTSDLIKLGYDAVFDDTGAIHVAEVQLVVLNLKILKIVDVETQNIKRGQYERVKKHLDALDSYLKSYGKTSADIKKKTDRYSKQDRTIGELRLTLEDDQYIVWKVEEDEANHKMWVTMEFSNIPDLQNNWGTTRESIHIKYDEFSEIKKLVSRIMSKISNKLAIGMQ